jgi:hypothetical protein
MTDVVATNQTILVVGGGISGMTAALEAAEDTFFFRDGICYYFCNIIGIIIA